MARNTLPEGPFVHGAKVQTALMDFARLRKAIRDHDSFAAEKAWDRCERWLPALIDMGCDA